MDGVTMDGGHPIKPCVEPTTSPAGQSVFVIPRTGLYQFTMTFHPTPPEEAVSDPESGISAAEQFHNEVNARAHAARQQARAQEIARTVSRFDHHPPTGPHVVQAHEQARSLGKSFAQWLMMFVPDCDERDLALDALDLAVMHTNAAIARTQLDGAWHVGQLPENPPAG